MQKKQLRKFILISVAFHVVLISVILLYFFRPAPTGGKFGTVMVGVISSKEINRGESSTVPSYDDSKSRNNKLSKSKVVLDKEPVKQIIQEQKIIQKKEKPSQIETSDSKTKSTTKVAAKSASNSQEAKENEFELSRPNNSGKPNKGQEQALGISGTNTQLAYPDYNLNPKPKYPRVARKRGYEGEVKLKVLVLKSGKVGQIEVVRPSGHEILDDSALEAVRNWVFVPGKENGKEISSWVTVPITFQLKSG